MFNRSLKESTDIVLNLPYAPSAEAKSYILTHENPKITNREEYNVKQQTQAIHDFKSGYTLTLPPSSLIIITNEEK